MAAKKRTKKIIYDPSNYAKTKMTGTVYGKGDQKIKKTKIVDSPRKTKTVNYGPVNYYGKRTKTKVIVKKK